jgi:3-hydroxyisobutyrate dehydrogenase-like beta-hydroxyacid dehydrogenase
MTFSARVAGTGPKVVYLGENGAGLVMKIAMNLELGRADVGISPRASYAG